MRVLLACNHLEELRGSEIHVLELARFFRQGGHQLHVAAYHVGGQLRPLLEDMGAAIRVLGRETLEDIWDIVWTHHVTAFAAIHAKAALSARRHIHGVLSTSIDVERPPFLAGMEEELQNCIVLANSPETAKHVEHYAGAECKARVLFNFGKFHSSSIEPDILRRVVIVSNHIPVELQAAANILIKNGISVDLVGKKHKRVLVDQGFLSNYDAVVSIGKTVQYAIGIGLPVFVYDTFGGPGYLTGDNFSAAEFFNFSGRCSGRRRKPEAIASEIIGGWTSALADADRLRQAVSTRYDIDCQMQHLGLLDIPPVHHRPLITCPENRGLIETMSNAYASLTDNGRWSTRMKKMKWALRRLNGRLPA